VEGYGLIDTGGAVDLLTGQLAFQGRDFQGVRNRGGVEHVLLPRGAVSDGDERTLDVALC
jgi:hypothetical protein